MSQPKPPKPPKPPKVGVVRNLEDIMQDSIASSRHSIADKKQGIKLKHSPYESSFVSTSTDPISYVCDGYDEYVAGIFLHKHLVNGTSIFRFTSGKLWIPKEDYYNVVKSLQDNFNLIVSPGSDAILLNEDIFIDLGDREGEIVFVTVSCTDKSIADEIFKLVRQYDRTVPRLNFHWIFDTVGNYIRVTEEFEESVEPSLYPFIKDFDTFAQRFINSKSNILILQGPPGTGKTTLIKHLIHVLNKEAYVTYDSQILSTDGPFAGFIGDYEAGAFVIEDADLFLDSRANGNGMVSRFLNIGDGLIKLKNKKLIFSTNLPNLKDIDPALVRPGRCFEIIQFRNLTQAEAEVVAKERNLVIDKTKEDLSLAEIFNSPVSTGVSNKTKFGFC